MVQVMEWDWDLVVLDALTAACQTVVWSSQRETNLCQLLNVCHISYFCPSLPLTLF